MAWLCRFGHRQNALSACVRFLFRKGAQNDRCNAKTRASAQSARRPGFNDQVPEACLVQASRVPEAKRSMIVSVRAGASNIG
jgi:hypothetical protein